MEKTCLKCGHAAIIDDNPMAECPNCGAIYAKVDAHQAQMEKERAAQSERDAARAAVLSAKKAQIDAEQKAAFERTASACRDCGTIGQRSWKKTGSGAMELWLWIVGVVLAPAVIGLPILVGAIIYSCTRKHVGTCSRCGSEALVPLNSPAGKELAARFGGQ